MRLIVLQATSVFLLLFAAGGRIGLAFDPQHRLWVVNNQSATLVRFDTAQLAGGRRSGAGGGPNVDFRRERTMHRTLVGDLE